MTVTTTPYATGPDMLPELNDLHGLLGTEGIGRAYLEARPPLLRRAEKLVALGRAHVTLQMVKPLGKRHAELRAIYHQGPAC